MMGHRIVWVMAVALAGGLAFASPPEARADALACQRAIAKASATYVQGVTKALARCQQGKVAGRIRPDDPCAIDPATLRALDSARVGLFAGINRGCGGNNDDC